MFCNFHSLPFNTLFFLSAQQTHPFPFECGPVAVDPERLPGPDRDPQRGAGRPPGHQGRARDGAGRHAHRHRGPLGVHQHREGVRRCQ